MHHTDISNAHRFAARVFFASILVLFFVQLAAISPPVLAPPVLAPAALSDPTLCPHCKSTGKVPNKYYEEHGAIEEGVLYCSHAIEEDKTGRGLPWIPCPRCRNKEAQAKAQAEFDAKVKVIEDWLAERRKVDKDVGARKPLLHLQTEHFVWAWNIPRFKGKDKKIYNMHKGLHLYAKRMEDFYRDWQRVHKVTDDDNVNNLHQIYCFESQRESGKACVLYADLSSLNGKASKQGTPSVYVTWWNKAKTPTDEDFHLDLIHNGNHLFSAVYKNHYWLHEFGVAYEGGSHWWEIYYYGRAISRCFVETDSGSAWKDGKWQAIVKKAVQADRQPLLVDLLKKPGTMLLGKEHPFAWSYIDYMMSIDPHKVMDFYLVIKERKHPREAFKKAFGLSIPAFEEAWKQYVIDNYSLQDDSPAIPKRLRRR